MTPPFQFSPLYIVLIVAVLLLPGGLLLSPFLIRRKQAGAARNSPSRQDGAIAISGQSLPPRRPNARRRAISAPIGH